MQERRDPESSRDGGGSRTSASSTSGGGIRLAEPREQGLQGIHEAYHFGQAEPHEEPPNRADRPLEQHLQISLTGRRRRFTLEPPWQVWFAESSQCFHRRRECRGLRNANRVQGHPICGICQQAA